MMEEFSVSQGATLLIQVTLRDGDGNVIDAYTGAEALTTSVWPGGSRSAAFAASTVWVEPGQGQIAIVVDATESAGLAPGRYHLLTRLDDDGSPVDAYRAILLVRGAPGAEPAPFSYITADDLLEFAPEVARVLADDSDETGFAEQLAQASEQFDRMVLNRYHPQPGRSRRFTDAAGTGPGPYLRYSDGPAGAPAPTRQEVAAWLGTAAVIVSADLLECVAHLALSIIYLGSPGRDNVYRETGTSERQMARECFGRIFVEIDTDDDGTADIRVDQDVVWLT